jgi:hypothetical protein
MFEAKFFPFIINDSILRLLTTKITYY